MPIQTVQNDFSSGALPVGLNYAPETEGITSFQRNWLGQFLTGTGAADYEDYMRSEYSANNQYIRDLALQSHANAFSAGEAQKQRDFEERMSSTAYRRAVADMKSAGINPVLMLGQQGGASTPTGSSATASGARSGGGSYSHKQIDSSAAIIAGVFNLVGGLISKFAILPKAMGKIGF